MKDRAMAAVMVLVLPLLATTVSIAWFVISERAGRAPLSQEGSRNSAEAAASNDAPAMLRFLRFGDDPTRVHTLRPHIISAHVQKATTPEAAMWSRQIEMVRLLDREGAIIGDDMRRELACLAADLDLPDIAEYLAPHQRCVPGAAMKRVIARTIPEVAQGHE